MSFPASPPSTGSDAPNSATTWSQKFVLPCDVALMEPVGSATASYVNETDDELFTSFPDASTTCAWIVL